MKTIRDYILLPVMLSLFDGELNPNVTTGDGMSAEMKTFYSDYLIDLAEPELVHDQFGQKHPIPKNGGKVIEFRQYDPLPEQTTPLTEGVTPDGQSLTVKTITSEVKQYGGYVTLSDMLMMTAIDNNLLQATKLTASQRAGLWTPSPGRSSTPARWFSLARARWTAGTSCTTPARTTTAI